MSGPSLAQAVTQAVLALTEAGVPSPRADAVALAAHALDIAPGEVQRLVILDRGEVPEEYAALVAERARRVPLQHLTGRAAFRRLTLAVGPGVFVPRPETESMVEPVLHHLAGLGRPGVAVDLCSGSGALAFAVRDESPQTQVYAVELSPDALAWAALNRDRLGLDVTLVAGDATADDTLADLDGHVDVVLSNPPYIPPDAVPQDPEVFDHDPELALYGRGPDGLAIARRVAARSARLLRPGGLLVMEHADTQGPAMTASLQARGAWSDIEDHRDLTGRPRFVTAYRRDEPDHGSP